MQSGVGTPRIFVVEGLFEIEEVGEILRMVFILLYEDALFDHREYDTAHVLRLVNAPVLEHGPGEGTVPPKRQLSNAIGEFAPRDVTRFVERPDDRVQCVQDELVGAGVEPWVPLLELVEYFVCKLNVRHGDECGKAPALALGGAPNRPEGAVPLENQLWVNSG